MRISDWSSDVCSSDLSFIIPQIDPDAQLTQEVDGDGIGDVELALHYQINSGLDDWPIFIGNLRYKSPSGEGPFDVDRDANGLESELATGSGFHGIEPSVTILSPNDPAVFFANFGRSEERRVGKECVRTCRLRGWPYN